MMPQMTAVFLTGAAAVAADVEKEIGLFQNYWDGMSEKLLGLSVRVVLALVVFFIGSRVIRFLIKLMNRALQKMKLSEEAFRFLDSAFKGGMYALLVVQIALQLGVEAASLATIVASAGVTVGLAIQGSLSNCIGGLLILILKPFKIGDYIVEDNAKNEGTVQEITIFYTKLATVDNKIVLLPNGSLANSSITNVTDEPYRRMTLLVGISYEADIKKAKAEVSRLMAENERIRKDMDQLVYVDDLGASSVVLGIRYWTRKEDYWSVKWEMLEQIKETFDESGIGIPYNQLDVHLISK